MQLNSNQIAQILPHRYPFALVDRIVDGEEGQWARGIKCVSANEQFFCGHFPQEHIMPGVLILEAMAQVGAVALLSLPENRGKIALFGGVKNARAQGDPGRRAGDDLYADKSPRPGGHRQLRGDGRRRGGLHGGAYFCRAAGMTIDVFPQSCYTKE